jgi:hypothetical protein
MAETKYIDENFARVKVREPLANADTEVISQAIVDACDQVDSYLDAALQKRGITVAFPLTDPNDLTDNFKVAVAYWTAGIVLETHTSPEAGARMIKRAKGLLDEYLTTHHFTPTTEKEPVSKPTVVPYSNKGEVPLTNLRDPMDLLGGDC